MALTGVNQRNDIYDHRVIVSGSPIIDGEATVTTGKFAV
jgi:hypothetical protein